VLRHEGVCQLNPVTRCCYVPRSIRAKRQQAVANLSSGYFYVRSSGRLPQYQWNIQQHWKQRQLLEFLRELNNKRLEPEPELQQRKRKP